MKKLKKLRHLLAMLLTLLLCVGEFAATGLTVHAATEYDLWVGGVRVTSDNLDNIGGVTGTGAKASYDPTTKTLTFENVTGFVGTYNNAYIFATEDLTIDGDVSVTGNISAYGIYATENVTIKGDLAFEESSDNTEWECRVKVNGTLCVDGGSLYVDNYSAGTNAVLECSDLHVKSGSVTAYVQHYDGTAIEVVNELKIEGGKVTAYVWMEDELGYVVVRAGTLTMTGGILDVSTTWDGYLEEDDPPYYALIADSINLGDTIHYTTPADGNIGTTGYGKKTIVSSSGDSVLSIRLSAVEEYDLWVGGTRITSENKNNIPTVTGTGAKASYDPETKTLTFEKVTGFSGTPSDAYIYAKDDLTIDGDVSFTWMGKVRAIYAEQDLTIKGTLTFNETAEDSEYSSTVQKIYVNKKLYVDGGSILASSNYFDIIWCSDLQISSGKVTAMANSAARALHIDKELKIEGGEVALTSKGGSVAAWVRTLTMTGGSLEVTQTVEDEEHHALYAGNIDLRDSVYITTPAGGKIATGTMKTIADMDGNPAYHIIISYEKDYDLWVGGVPVTESNKGNILGDGKASYDPETKTLTLDDAVISKTQENGYIIMTLKDLTIEGTGTLKNTEAKGAIASGSSGNPVLKLDADLDINADMAGVFAYSGEVQIIGGNTAIETYNAESYGILAPKLVISGGNTAIVSKQIGVASSEGNIVITGGTVEASGETAALLTGETFGITIDDKLEITKPAGAEVAETDTLYSGNTYITIVDGDGEVATSVKIEPKKTVTEYTVSFDANGKTATDMPAAQTVEDGGKATKPAKSPKADGFVFAGWYTSADCKDSEKYDFNGAVTGDVTLYAKWSVANVDITGVTLDKTTVSLVEEDTVSLTATVTPADATDKTVTWSSNKTGVATVDANGKVTAVKAGTAIITVTATNGTDDTADDKTATCTVTVTEAEAPKVDVSKVTLDQSAVSLTEEETVTLIATVTPTDATDKTVTWSSDKESVATVDADGKVTAVKAGTAIITVTATNGTDDTTDDKTATCTVTVTEAEAPKTDITGITLNKTSVTVEEGKTESLTATVAPDDATDKTVTWTSSDTGIVTVDEEGKITAVAVGNAVIIVTATNGTESAGDDKTTTCIVNVVAAGTPKTDVTGVTLTKTETNIREGEIENLKYTVAPDDATDKTVTWKSSDETVATVDNSGKVTAVAAGTATITVTATNGTEDTADDKTATCEVTVTAATEPKTDITGVTLDKMELTVEEGKTETLAATVAPEDASSKDVIWSSSDETIATIDADGVVVAVKAGTATITVTATNGTEDTADDKTVTCEVTVTEAAVKTDITGITLDKTTVSLEVEQTETLTVTVEPEEATDKTLTFKSSDEKIATVDEEGKITAVAEGSTVIIVTADNGTAEAEDDKTATCIVTVTAKKTSPEIPEKGTALVKDDQGKLVYYKDGEPQKDYSGLANVDGTWYYVEKGVLSETETGFVMYEDGLFLVVEGKLLTSKSGLVQDPYNPDIWYFLADGQVQSQYTGLALYDGEWFYVNKGRLDTTIAAYIEYDGGLFYVAAGRILKEVSGLAQDPNGPDWYFLAEGQAQTQYTGLTLYDGEWFYVVDGKLAEDYTGTVEYDGSEFNVVNGMVK